jgi:hypothetical protein
MIAAALVLSPAAVAVAGVRAEIVVVRDLAVLEVLGMINAVPAGSRIGAVRVRKVSADRDRWRSTSRSAR